MAVPSRGQRVGDQSQSSPLLLLLSPPPPPLFASDVGLENTKLKKKKAACGIFLLSLASSRSCRKGMDFYELLSGSFQLIQRFSSKNCV